MPRPSPSPRAELEIRVLGPFEVLVEGAPLAVDTRKALAMLALLAVEQRPFARDELAAMLWPESDDESARGALRRTLSVLRGALGGRWLIVTRATLGLDPAGTWLDLRALEAAAESSELGVLRAAAELARGAFLAGFTLRDSPEFDDWRATRASAIERLVGTALDRLRDAAEAVGELHIAIGAASRRVDLDPLDEDAHRQLILLLARSGDRAGAIRQYRACVAILERELGVAPLAETTSLYDAVRDARPIPGPGPIAPAAASGGRPSMLPLVGRDGQLAALLGAVAQSVPNGRLALVTGEAGIGKTRLVEALVEAVPAPSRVIVSRAYAAESGIAYAPVIDLLRTGLGLPGVAGRLAALDGRSLAELDRLVPLPVGLAPPVASVESIAPPGQVARARLLEAVADGLVALVGGPVPGVIVVEDVQWADDASQAALAWLARRLDGRPVALVLTWRPEDLDDAASRFAQSLAGLPGVASVDLARLDSAAVGLLVGAAEASGRAPGSGARLFAESEGLPLFVVEALQGGSSDGPAGATANRSIQALIRERLAAVSETASQVAGAAAVIGRSFDLALVRGTSGRSDDETVGALEELARRGVVRELEAGRGAGFDFAHAAFRDVTYESLSLARRRLLHRRVADLLRSDPVGREVPGRLAQVAGHELAAGRDIEAAEAYRQAGDAARRVAAGREAAGYLETALALGHPDQASIQATLGDLRAATGDYAGSISALEAAAAISSGAGLATIELRLGRVHALRGDPETARSHLEAAIESTADPVILARALVERALVAIGQADPALAEESAGRALAIAGEQADSSLGSAANRMLGLAARERGNLALARELLERSLGQSARDPDPSASIAAGNALALVEAASGDVPAAIDRLETALDLCRRTGQLHLEAAIENNLADQLHAAGRHDEAMAHLKRAVTLFADIGGRPGELAPEVWKLVSW
jgi:DNA-binding SARP family transcriptional activator/tetratricopeptide (TPR) repeat protein